MALGQSKCRINIQEITLKDSVMIDVIHQVVNSEEQSTDSTNFFKRKLGYIAVYISEPHNRDTLLKYEIEPRMRDIKEDADDSVFPLFYSYVSGKLILIYFASLRRITDCPFTLKSKRAIRKKINTFLEPTKKVTFYDTNHKRVFTDRKFRIDYIKYDAGKTVFIMRNRAPIIRDTKDLY